MDRQSWLEWRQRGIGSSDAAAILGKDPWKTRRDVYNSKVNPSLVPDNDNWAMQRGRDLEPHVRSLLENRYNIFLEPRNIEVGQVWQASVDAISFDGTILFEIKCPGEKAHSLARKLIVPDYYMPQLQHQLLVTALPMIHYVSYMNDDDWVMFTICRDEVMIEDLKREETLFWNEHVLKRIPPAEDERDYVTKTDDMWSDLGGKYQVAINMRKSWEEKESTFKQALIDLAGERNAEGRGIRLTRSEEDGRIDYKKAYEELAFLLKFSPQESLVTDVERYRNKPLIKYRITLE